MANTNPLRILFVRTPEGKDRLVPLMAEGNQAKTRSAPAVAVLVIDTDFHEKIPELFPARPEMREVGSAGSSCMLHTDFSSPRMSSGETAKEGCLAAPVGRS